MNKFQSKFINTDRHVFVGLTWPFRGCEVELCEDGFTCTCREKHRYKCNHIKSVEFALAGVNAKDYML